MDDFPETKILGAGGLNDRGEIGGTLVDLWDGTETPVVLIPVDATRQVRIDVKPDVYPSCFRIDGRRTVPVAIFGEEENPSGVSTVVQVFPSNRLILNRVTEVSAAPVNPTQSVPSRAW